MKHLIFIILAILLSCCGHDDAMSRHDFGNNGDREETGDKPTSWPDDNKELADPTVRIKAKDFEISYGKPGILYSISDNGTVKLIDIEKELALEFSTGTRILKLNGNTISQNMILFNEDRDKGLKWYHGSHETDKSPVYVVWSEF